MNPSSAIIFLGTSDFAVPSLQRLVADGLPVSLVITRPDRPARRGQRLSGSPILCCAESLGLPVWQPENLQDAESVHRIQEMKPSLLVLVAYGMRVPGDVLQAGALGALNLHPSLLPKYRGAAPMQWALIHAEKMTGVTTMYMDEGLDTGDIVYQENAALVPGETYGEVSSRLSVQGAALLSRTVQDVLNGTAPRKVQDNALATKAPLLKPEQERLRWDQEATRVAGWICGLSPRPGAYTLDRERRLKLLRARPLEDVPELVSVALPEQFV
ncbi:MAG TPA: methionyl-tRNA formyltransferase, partial [bacterium]|nr:methionyl-tRNA formyltransferase [bacterium]